jgi:mRNA interferase RelE/StbE
MSHRVLIPKPVRKQLDKLPASVRNRVLRRLIALQEDPRPPGCVKLKDYDSEYRVRIGDYRLRYTVIDESSTVVLLHCKDRKEVYRR